MIKIVTIQWMCECAPPQRSETIHIWKLKGRSERKENSIAWSKDNQSQNPLWIIKKYDSVHRLTNGTTQRQSYLNRKEKWEDGSKDNITCGRKQTSRTYILSS